MSGSDKPFIRLHCCGFVFTPKFVPTLVLVIILPALIGLGVWQCQRAEVKKAMMAKIAAYQEQPAIDLAQLLQQPQKALRRVTIKGRYDNQHTLLLDNRMHQHQVGYEVITPFRPEGKLQQEILVNRGWIAQGRDRRRLPKIAPIAGPQTIEGIIKYPSNLLVLAHQAEKRQWPWRVQSIEIQKIQQALGKPLQPFMLLLSPSAPGGFAREWNLVTMKAQKHYGYAFQWFALALTLVIIYLVINTRRGSYGETRKE